MREDVFHKGLHLGRLLASAWTVKIKPGERKRKFRQYALQLFGSNVGERKLLEGVRESDTFPRCLHCIQGVTDRQAATHLIVDATELGRMSWDGVAFEVVG